jgi:AcrR family transcriptional regulator
MSSVGTPARAEVTLRDRAREAIREEVLTRAWLLFAEQGFAATTIEQVAEAAGMSRRTFFRYFSGKDELVAARLLASGDQLAAALEARPGDEPAWQALRAAFAELITKVEEHEEIARPLHVMLQHEPEVRAAAYERGHLWLELLEPLLARRMDIAETTETTETTALRARALIGSAIACFDAAQLAWAARPGARLGPLVDEAMQAVAPIS